MDLIGRAPAVTPGWTAPVAAALLLAATAAGQTIAVDPPVSDGTFTVTWTGSQAPTADTFRVAESGPDGDHIHTVSPIELSGRPAGLYTFTLQRCSTRPRSRSDEDGDDPPDPRPSTRSPVCLPAALDFAHVNTRPAVSAIADRTMTAGATATVAVAVTDADASDAHTVVAESSAAAVVGVTVSAKTLTLTAASVGAADVTVTAGDGSGAANATSTPVSFRVTVVSGNSRPVVSAIPDIEVAKGSTGTRTATVTDADAGDSHTVSAASGDASVATVAVSGKRLTVGGVGCGAATMTVTAADDSGAANATSTPVTFAATVPNVRPAVDPIADVEVANGSTASRDVAVTDDACGGAGHTLTAVSDDASVATAAAAGGRVEVTGAGRGTATVTVTATDLSGRPNAAGTATFGVTVPNSRPAVAPLADVELPNNPGTAVRDVTVTDADAEDAHEVTATSDDEDVATVSVDGKRVTVSAVGRGTATMAVTATDGIDPSPPTTFAATVANSRPVVGAMDDPAVPGAGGAASVDVTVTDRDARDTHTVTATSGNESVATVSVAGTRLTVRGVHRGEAAVTVTATDNSRASNASGSRTVTARVANSRPAVGLIADVRVDAGSTATRGVTVTDADARDTHTVAAASSDALVAAATVNAGRVEVRGVACGIATVTVTATDGSRETNATSAPPTTFAVTVPNRRPVVDPIADVELANGATAERIPAVADDACGGAGHTLTARSDDDRVATASVAGGRVRVTGTGRGTATVTVTATDQSEEANAASTPVTFRVTVPNSRPVLGAVDDRTVGNGATSTIAVLGDPHAPTATSTILVPVTDADARDAHALTATSSAPTVARIVDLDGWPALVGAGRGTTTVTLWARDGSGAANATSTPRTFAATVPNSRPAVDPIADLSVRTGATTTVAVLVADADAVDADLGHRVTATSADPGVATVSATGTPLLLTGVARGTTEVTVRAADGSGEPNATSTPTVFRVTVGNSRPTVAAIADLTVDNGVTATVDVEVSDADPDDRHVLTVASDDNATALAYPMGGSAMVRGLHRGTATVSVTATDDSGADNATSDPPVLFGVTVPNSRPAVGAMPDVVVGNGHTHAARVPVRDADARDAHTLTATSSDSLVAAARPSGRDVLVRGVGRGAATVSVTATDDSRADNATSEPPTQFRVTVPNSRPAVSPVAAVAVPVGGEVVVVPRVTDADARDAHTLAATSTDPGIAAVAASGGRLTVSGIARGRTTVQATAMDGSGETNDTSAPTTFDVTVRPAGNSRPVIAPIGDVGLAVGATSTVAVMVADADAGDRHTVTASSTDRTVATVAVSGTRLTLTGVSAGTAAIGVAAEDDSAADNALSETVTFSATVAAVSNRPPEVGHVGHVIVREGAAVAVTVPFRDADGDAVTLTTVSENPAVASVAASSTVLALPASATSTNVLIGGVAEGRATVRAEAWDGAATSTPLYFRTTVVAPPPAGERAFWVAPEVNGGDYTVGWRVSATSTPVLWELRESGPDGSPGHHLPGAARAMSFTGRRPGTYTYTLWRCDPVEDRLLDDVVCLPNDLGTVQALVVGGTPVVIEPGTTPGTVPYMTGVTKGGDAYVNIPVSVVAGVNGLAPALSVDYSDGRGRQRAAEDAPGDLLGYGWRVGGFSAIRRCVRDTADGDGISLDGTDRLCIDGERLVLVGGDHLRPGAAYRTLRESYARITVRGTAAAPWFEVQLPDGGVREYGRTDDARLDFATLVVDGYVAAEAPLLWSVNRETDAFGNAMTYEYLEDQTSGVRHPRRIVYGDGGDAEVFFEYVGRHDLADVEVAGHGQRRWLRLQRIGILLDGVQVREYRLWSDETDEGWRRLAKIQLCGWRDAGAGGKDCLDAFTVDWERPAESLPHMKTCVAGIVDPLGRETRFARQVLKTEGSGTFAMGAASPFAGSAMPENAEPLPGNADGNAKSVVTAVLRDDGVGGTHRTTYGYQGRGWRSTRNWGFLGFSATRRTDEASGISTYTQYRLDFPHFAEPARVFVYDGRYATTTPVLSKRHVAHARAAIAHGAGADAPVTYAPYVAKTTESIREGGVEIGARQSTFAPTLTAGGPTRSVRTEAVGDGTTTGAAGTVWGAVPEHTLTDARRTARTTTTYANEGTASSWLVGFPSRVTVEHFAGAAAGTAARTRTLALTRHPGTNAVSKEVRFPGDAELALTTTVGYDAHGNVETTTVSGANVAARTTRASNFASGRFPGTVTNALGHAETFVWDAALGLPTRVADANGRVLNIGHDALGRVVSRERVWDGVTETTAYAACGGSCPAVRASAADCGTAGAAAADLGMKSTTSSPVAPTTVRHFDVLGRRVRTEVESFGSPSVHRTADVLYDGRGLVACASAPYHTGGDRHFERHAHDVRGRLTRLDRAGGGAVEVAYAADAANHRVAATVVETVTVADGTAPRGTRKRVLTYDVLGDLVESAENPDGTVDGRSEARYAYDGGGLLERVELWKNGAAVHTTSFVHDAAGNRDSATGPDFGTRSFGHTALGELRTATDGRGGVTAWTYDLLGRPRTRTDPGGGTASWTWDTAAVGLPAGRSYDDSATTAVEYEETYAYDAEARPTAATTTVRPTATSTETFTRGRTYDANGRPARATHASGVAVDYEYNARGYLWKLKHGAAALVTYAEADAWGNPTRETYGNGVSTTRTFDPATGRVTAISTTLGTSPTFQAETYAWRSDGLLEGRTRGTVGETFVHDALGRLTGATTRLAGPDRTLAYGYDALGNVKPTTGGAAAESTYGTGPAPPTRLASAVLDGRAVTFAYDAGGQVVRYDAASGDDVFVEWDGRGGLPARITVGASKADPAPAARDGFRYGPSGERYLRRSAWRETADGTPRTRTSETVRVGATERVAGDAFAAHPWVEKTRIGPVLAVRTSATSTAAFEYVHADHLGSPAAATDAAGAELLALAHDPYGARRRADWTARLPAAQARALAAGADAGRTRAGFTGHETLDRTGFVHMNGRLYDPRLGRFLSPDPVVSRPWSGQGWNPYSYVGNSPMSRTDPTGYCYHESMPCAGQGGGFPGGGGGGFTPVTAALLTGNLSFEIPLYFTVRWGSAASISVGASVSRWDEEDSDASLFGGWEVGHNRPYVTFEFGPPTPVWWSAVKGVALGQEVTHADGAIVWDMRMVVDAVDAAADVGEWTLDFVILDSVGTGVGVYRDARDGNHLRAGGGVLLLTCDVAKFCKLGGKILGEIPGVGRAWVWIKGKWTRITGRVVRPAGVPDDWIVRPAGKGRAYIDPENTHNWVRVMPGNPRSPYANSRQPYVRWQKNGRALDVDGIPVPRQSRESHIPVEDFVFDATLFE